MLGKMTPSCQKFEVEIYADWKPANTHHNRIMYQQSVRFHLWLLANNLKSDTYCRAITINWDESVRSIMTLWYPMTHCNICFFSVVVKMNTLLMYLSTILEWNILSIRLYLQQVLCVLNYSEAKRDKFFVASMFIIQSMVGWYVW